MGRLKENKLYSAQEIIEIIEEGWETEDELRELYEFIEAVQMKDSDELNKLCDSGYTNLVYDSYEPEE